MGKINVCDLCKKELLSQWTDRAYKFKVWETTPAYDGFITYRRKRRIEICGKCIDKLITPAPTTNRKK